MKNQRGVSLIESLLVVVVIGSVVFLLASLPNAMMLVGKSKNMSLAREIAVKQMEDKRTLSYINLVNDSSPVTDPRLNLLPQGSGTTTVSDCNPAVCTNNESLKEVEVTITWLDNNKPQEVKLKTMIGEGGINQ